MTGSREEIVAQLRQKLAAPAGDNRAADLISTGSPDLDQLLPQGGFAPGTLVEWLAAGSGSGAHIFALAALLSAGKKRGALIVCDQARSWNPPVIQRAPLPDKLLVLRPATLADQFWAAEQALRSPAVAAVWLPCERIDARDFRRLQLAAETGGTLGLLLRPARVRSEPSWAEVRFLIEPYPGLQAGRRWRVSVLRCRGGGAGKSVELVLDDRASVLRKVKDNDETLPLSAVSALANSATRKRSAGA